MKRRIRAGGLFEFAPKAPPTEIQLWNAGDNPTDYGVHRWTERSVAEVLGRYESRGNPLLIDVEHNGAKAEDGEPATTGGYARLELRAGEPWLVFDWSAYADEQIRSGERRFLSPEYDVDRSTGEIVALYRVSLVADPGTHRARMLAAAATNTENSMNAMILAALRAALAAEDPAVAKASIQSLVDELAKADGGASGDEASQPTAAGAGEAPGAGDGTIEAEAAPSSDKAPPVAAAAPAVAASKAVAAAAAPAAPAKGASGATADVVAIAAAAALQVENAQRDLLLQTDGARLEPAVRRWASAQPLAVVKGLIDATPANLDPPGQVHATRGQGHGANEPKEDPSEAEHLDRHMGIRASSPTFSPTKNDKADLVFPSATPSELRKHIAASSAGKVK